MTKLKMSLAAFALIAFAGVASAGLWSNFPIIGGASYCASYNNGVCTSTIPAGPNALTGNETIPVDTNLSQGRSPQTALVTPAALNANPIYFAPASATPAGISASNLDGGVVFSNSTTITSANVSLPTNAMQGQQYSISANRTITTLSVSAAPGDAIAANSAPTVLTASTTVPQGYNFICNKAGGTTCTWYRLQ